MDYILPNSNGYTIYSKSGCPFCTKVKKLLVDVMPAALIIDCDEYLITDKEDFLEFIKQMAGKKHKTFPMIFHNGDFIGGFTETKAFFEKSSAFDDI